MAYLREKLVADFLAREGEDSEDPLVLPWRASDLAQATDGQMVWIAGMVICRQRPGTAKGHVFVSLEDETGISNAFVPGPVFEQYLSLIHI